jgi:hypothetical protein
VAHSWGVGVASAPGTRGLRHPRTHAYAGCGHGALVYFTSPQGIRPGIAARGRDIWPVRLGESRPGKRWPLTRQRGPGVQPSRGAKLFSVRYRMAGLRRLRRSPVRVAWRHRRVDDRLLFHRCDWRQRCGNRRGFRWRSNAAWWWLEDCWACSPVRLVARFGNCRRLDFGPRPGG